MRRFGYRQAGSDVDTLTLFRPSFESFLRSLQQGCMLLAEPSYLSCLALMKVVVGTLLPEAPPMVAHHQLAPDQLVM
jgi:hypothetical protein